MNPTATNAIGTNTHSYPAYDYPVGIGTGLVAVKDGTIVDMGTGTRRLMGNLSNTENWPLYKEGAQNSGNVINIDHGNGEITSYLHTSPFDVNAFRGRKVRQGEIFHKSGHNGWSTGPHLHFEVWKNGVRIDPGPWLANIKPGGNMTNDTIEKFVSQCYRAATDIDPTPEQAGYWVERIKANQQTAPELPAALGGNTYQGDPLFRTKARNYDKDVAAAGGGYVKTEVYIKK